MTDKLYRLDVAKWRAHNCANCTKYDENECKCDIDYELCWYVILTDEDEYGISNDIAERMGWRDDVEVWDCPEKESKTN